MNKKSPIEHQFFTLEELIAKLKEKGLKIIDDSKLLWYLKSYNYQNVINEYRKPFLTNHQRYQYLENANSQMIIDLFNFNRSISNILIGDLHSIEMQLSSAIALELTEIIDKLHPKRTSFCALTTQERSQIFKLNNEKQIEYVFESLQSNFLQLRKNKEYIDVEWEKWDEVPMYSLPLLWTFGISINIFCCLNPEIKKMILLKYFSKISNIDIKTFVCLLFCFNDLRNKISHNEVVYKFKLEPKNLINRISKLYPSIRRKRIVSILKSNFSYLLSTCEDIKIDLKLINIIQIIIKITNNHELEKLINNKLISLKNSINDGNHIGINQSIQYDSCKEAWKNICAFLGLNDEES